MRYLAAGSAYLAPPLLLASDVLLIQFISEPGLLVQRIALIVFVPGIAAAAVYGDGRARWLIGAGAMLPAGTPSCAPAYRRVHTSNSTV